jgi:hypothetical protein
MRPRIIERMLRMLECAIGMHGLSGGSRVALDGTRELLCRDCGKWWRLQ